MNLEDAILSPSALRVTVTNPESPFGGVQIVGISEVPVNVIVHEGAQGPPGPTGPVGPSGGDGPSGPIEIQNQGVTPLIIGQSYVDVVFDSAQADLTWIFVECQVINTVDATPLNIWTGLLTVKTTTGFRLQLSAVPDSGNYSLHWAVNGALVEPPLPFPATTYALTGPVSGVLGLVSGNFTAKLLTGSTVPGPITITPDDGGAGGTFAPVSVILTTSSASATFTYTPASYGAKTISTTNSGTLINPAPVTFTPVAGTYTLTGPSMGTISVASTNFTVALPVGAPVIGTVVVTPHDGGDGGTFTPTTVNLTTAAPSVTFTYTPASAGTKTINVTNNGGLTNPANLTYTVAVPLPTYSLSGPASGGVGIASGNFTVDMATTPILSGTVVVTPSDGGGGGTFTPTTVSLTTAAHTATFTYTAASSGAKSISVTNDRGLSDPGSLTYTAAAPHLLNTLISYWKLDEASTAVGYVQRSDTVGANHFTEQIAFSPSATGKISNAINGLGAGGYLTAANHSSLQVSGDFTFSLWVKVINYQASMTFFSKGDYTFRIVSQTVPPSTGTGFEFSISTGPIAKVGSQYTSTPPWAHIVCWYDSSDQKVRLRIDDSITYVSPTSAALPTPTSFVLALLGNTGGGETVNGLVDEWGFWKRLLTAAEITALYNGGAGLPYSSFTT